MPSKFRKRPVTVEAMQWDGTFKVAEQIETWSDGRVECLARGGQLGIEVDNMRSPPSYWIIKGAQDGLFYPMHPAEFDATYEAA